ncbi:phosphate regulon sensor histidine kinase PhoR [Kaarinaea lacus]
MNNPWVNEFWRIVVLIIPVTVVGAIFDAGLLVFTLALCAYFGGHIYQLYRLERWFSEGQRQDPPDAKGIWGEVFYHIYRLRQKNRISKKKLANMLSRFQKSTSAMPDATVVLNEQGEIEWFNRAAKQFLGLKKKKDRGNRIDNLIRYPRFVAMLASAEFDEPVEIPSPINEDLVLSVRLVPYAKKQLLLVARDVTRLHRLEQVRRDFVANISHELKTPLTVMNGYLENFVDDDSFALGPYAKGLQQMQQQTVRMSRIVDDLLMLARLETDEVDKTPETVAVPAMLASLFEDAELLAKEREQHLESEVDPALWLYGNEKELHSAFSNLLSNAVKYTPNGGDIGMRWYANEQGAYFEVTDTGDGIDADHLPRLTERFYRVDTGRSREQGGTGLGLAIVKHVLNRHNARLIVDSKLGEGSRFVCHFPPQKVMVKEQKLDQKVS